MKFHKYLKDEQLLEAEGRFDYTSQADQERHRTLEGMIKNNGLFKSMKQRNFLTQRGWEHFKVSGREAGGAASIKKYKGINVSDDDYFIEVHAVVVFGQRGAGSGTRWLTWCYVCDDVGVREKYKLFYNYAGKGFSGETTGVDPSKTKLVWQRKADAQVDDFREKVAIEDMERKNKIKAGEAQLKNSEWIGVIGERVKDIEVEVIRKHFFETQFGTSSITVMKTVDGNMIHHFGSNSLNRGDKKKVSFTVKDHEKAEVNKWNKIPYKYTSVKRVK